MSDPRYDGMPSFLLKPARRRALRDRDTALLAALPPMPPEDDQDDDEPPVSAGIAMPRVYDLGSLQLLIRRATQDPRVVLFAVKAAARLGRVQDLPVGWVTGHAIDKNQRRVRLSDDGNQLTLANVVGTDARRLALLEDGEDQDVELDEDTAAELNELVNPPERLRVTPEGARLLHRAAYPASYRPGKVRGRGGR